MHDINLCETFECTHLRLMVSGRSKQASKHTHARAQYSHPSVGLAQAHPNYGLGIRLICTVYSLLMFSICLESHAYSTHVVVSNLKKINKQMY